MRRQISLLMCVLIMISSVCFTSVFAENIETASYSNYDIIVELAKAYDRQGEQILYDQYYARRSIYSSPEDATAQRTLFLDCSSYVNSCYREAFGVNILPYEIGETGASPSTVNYDNYAKNNPGASDVVGYWVPADYTTDAERQALVNEIYEEIQVGDILTYRHGTATSTKGHVYMYLGDSTFIHCAGAGSYVLNSSNPALSYDANASEITSKGTIGTISFSTIFEDSSHNRYIFKATTSDTVKSFGILRPMVRGLTPTEKAIKRMKIAGLSMEKTSSVWENASVDTGDILTYKVTLENTNSKALSSVEITDTLPTGTSFVSGDSGVSVEGNKLVWSGNVPAKSTVEVEYSVQITASMPGALIVSDATYVSGVKLSKLTHSVSGYSKTQRALIGETALNYAQNAKAFNDSLEMAKDIYKSTFGIDVFNYTTPGDVLDQLIDTTNRTKHTSTELSKIIAPNLYGGRDIMYGWLYLPSENEKTRLPKEEHLSVGDIIIADWNNGSTVYLYAGNKTLVTVENGVCKTLAIGENIYTPGDNILISLLGYDRYAVLRPTISADVPEKDVVSIAVTTPPQKLAYQSGETFDATGMIVTANLSDGKTQQIIGYTVSPKVLLYGMDAVNITFGHFTSTLDVSVSSNKLITSVSQASLLEVDSVATVEGIVVGVAHEGLNNDKEMIIKDMSNDALMAVRNIPYGSFPNYGYKKGDRIVFDATVKKDTSGSTCYSLKKYLAFSSNNGTIDTTIVSRNNKAIYNFDNVVTLDTWDDMKNFFKKSSIKPYTYVKVNAGSYFQYYSGQDTDMYRLHKNAEAVSVTGIKSDGIAIALRYDVMNANIGSDGGDLFFDEVVTGFPGTYVDKTFYAVFVGGNKTYFQLAIFDENWIFDSEFYVSKLNDDKKSVEINVPVAGTYKVILADYEGKALRMVDVVTKTVKANELGKVTVRADNKDIMLEEGDKVMIWSDLINIIPLCKDMVIE